MTHQLSLFASPPRARRLDPPTSHQAAKEAVTFAESHDAVILKAITEAPGGLIKDEIATLTGLTDIQVARRLSALEENGKIERRATRDGATIMSYETRPNARGRQCCVWFKVRPVEDITT